MHHSCRLDPKRGQRAEIQDSYPQNSAELKGDDNERSEENEFYRRNVVSEN